MGRQETSLQKSYDCRTIEIDQSRPWWDGLKCGINHTCFGVFDAMTAKWGITKEISLPPFSVHLSSQRKTHTTSVKPLKFMCFGLTSWFHIIIITSAKDCAFVCSCQNFKSFTRFRFFASFLKKQERFENFSIVEEGKVCPTYKMDDETPKTCFVLRAPRKRGYVRNIWTYYKKLERLNPILGAVKFTYFSVNITVTSKKSPEGTDTGWIYIG